jgi:hypothetical protein
MGGWPRYLVIELNLGAPRAVLARGVFDFAFAGNLNRVNLHQTQLPFFVERETAPEPKYEPCTWGTQLRRVLAPDSICNLTGILSPCFRRRKSNWHLGHPPKVESAIREACHLLATADAATVSEKF